MRRKRTYGPELSYGHSTTGKRRGKEEHPRAFSSSPCQWPSEFPIEPQREESPPSTDALNGPPLCPQDRQKRSLNQLEDKKIESPPLARERRVTFASPSPNISQVKKIVFPAPTFTRSERKNSSENVRKTSSKSPEPQEVAPENPLSHPPLPQREKPRKEEQKQTKVSNIPTYDSSWIPLPESSPPQQHPPPTEMKREQREGTTDGISSRPVGGVLFPKIEANLRDIPPTVKRAAYSPTEQLANADSPWVPWDIYPQKGHWWKEVPGTTPSLQAAETEKAGSPPSHCYSMQAWHECVGNDGSPKKPGHLLSVTQQTQQLEPEEDKQQVHIWKETPHDTIPKEFLYLWDSLAAHRNSEEEQNSEERDTSPPITASCNQSVQEDSQGQPPPKPPYPKERLGMDL